MFVCITIKHRDGQRPFETPFRLSVAILSWSSPSLTSWPKCSVHVITGEESPQPICNIFDFPEDKWNCDKSFAEVQDISIVCLSKYTKPWQKLHFSWPGGVSTMWSSLPSPHQCGFVLQWTTGGRQEGVRLLKDQFLMLAGWLLLSASANVRQESAPVPPPPPTLTVWPWQRSLGRSNFSHLIVPGVVNGFTRISFLFCRAVWMASERGESKLVQSIIFWLQGLSAGTFRWVTGG